MAALLDSIIVQFKSIYLIPENNNASAFIIATKQYSWRSYMYKQKVMDKVVMKDQDKYGFNTNASTKPILIMDFRKFIRTNKAFEVPEDEYEELCYFYYNEQGGMEAISPYHDDTVMSDALCIQGIVRGAANVNIYI
jgi:hypothetical protein